MKSTYQLTCQRKFKFNKSYNTAPANTEISILLQFRARFLFKIPTTAKNVDSTPAPWSPL